MFGAESLRLVDMSLVVVVRQELSVHAMYSRQAGTPKPSELKTSFKVY